MKPTIEEIKQKYANAKQIESPYGLRVVYNQDTVCFNEKIGSYYFVPNESIKKVCLYSGLFEKYAEIISYKEETLPIKKTTLLQLAENNSFSESIIKKEFPKLFESWYLNKWTTPLNGYEGKAFVFINNPDDLSNVGYGITISGEWTNNFNMNGSKLQNRRLATEQEVTEALTNEAVKKGFINGNTFKAVTYGEKIKITNSELDFEYFKDKNVIYIQDYDVFRDGVWAEILPQPKEITISEIEKILGYKILIKE